MSLIHPMYNAFGQLHIGILNSTKKVPSHLTFWATTLKVLGIRNHSKYQQTPSSIVHLMSIIYVCWLLPWSIPIWNINIDIEYCSNQKNCMNVPASLEPLFSDMVCYKSDDRILVHKSTVDWILVSSMHRQSLMSWFWSNRPISMGGVGMEIRVTFSFNTVCHYTQ